MSRLKFAPLLLIASLALTGCISREDPAQNQSSYEETDSAATAVVTRSTITGVLTFEGSVTQRDSFQIHALTSGVLKAINSRSFSIAPTGGETPVSRTLPDGVSVGEWLGKEGDNVVGGLPIATGTLSGFGIRAKVPVKALLKLTKSPIGVRAQVDGGSGPFDCPLADPIPTSSQEEVSGNESFLLCIVPEEAAVLAGMDATVVVQTDRAENVLTLPVEAVAGSVKSGLVFVRGDQGKPISRQVELGISDGINVEIRSGLSENDEVLIPGPQLRRSNG